MRSSVQVEQAPRGPTGTCAAEWDVARSNVRGQTDGDQLTFSGRSLALRNCLVATPNYSRPCLVLSRPGNSRRSSKQPRTPHAGEDGVACASFTNIARATLH